MTAAEGTVMKLGCLWTRTWSALALLVFSSQAMAFPAQSIQIELVNGKTGRTITYSSFMSLRTVLSVWTGRENELTLRLPADKHGVALLYLTHNDSEINVPDCKGMRADSEKLQMNRSTKDQEAFNKKYKYCTGFEGNKPIVRYADTLSIGPVIRTLNGTNYFQYVPCWADSATAFSTEEVLQHGVVTANHCGKAAATPQPGHLVLFVRSPTNVEGWRQAN